MLRIICVVDDEEDLIVNLKLNLEDLRPEWKVLGYNNGLDALREIVTGHVDLVLTDIAMPDMDGYELYWRIKDHDPELPVIMMTGFGYDPSHVLVRAKSDGLQDVLFKPFEIEKLVDLIDRRLPPINTE
ncbi:MAG TPA: response regulator [Candidatus Syntrophosphaera sp.]|nr:response regulator [Candidatus Syntrophosphaera sp.]